MYERAFEIWYLDAEDEENCETIKAEDEEQAVDLFHEGHEGEEFSITCVDEIDEE